MELLIKEITDAYIRENFTRLRNYFMRDFITDRFAVMDAASDQVQTNAKFYHGLGYVPLDVIVTRVSGAGKVTFNYDNFDRNYIDYTTDGACRIRALIGTLGTG